MVRGYSTVSVYFFSHDSKFKGLSVRGAVGLNSNRGQLGPGSSRGQCFDSDFEKKKREGLVLMALLSSVANKNYSSPGDHLQTFSGGDRLINCAVRGNRQKYINLCTARRWVRTSRMTIKLGVDLWLSVTSIQ